jgi:outer membrane protein W
MYGTARQTSTTFKDRTLKPKKASCSRTLLLEFKGAYFLPINSRFRKAYNNSSALCGPELTIQVGKNNHWTQNICAFLGVDYFQKKGHRLGLCDSKTLRLVPLTIGLKYIRPLNRWIDGYVGLGLESRYVQTNLHRGSIKTKNSAWAFGGITKLGININLPRKLFIDLFFDYSFINARMTGFYGPIVSGRKTNLSSALFGIGLGYRF